MIKKEGGRIEKQDDLSGRLPVRKHMENMKKVVGLVHGDQYHFLDIRLVIWQRVPNGRRCYAGCSDAAGNTEDRQLDGGDFFAADSCGHFCICQNQSENEREMERLDGVDVLLFGPRG